MKTRLYLIVRLFLFWLFVMVISRLVFIFYQHEFSFHLTPGEWTNIFIYGLRMDISVVGYIMALSLLLMAPLAFLPPKLETKILQVFSFLILLIYLLIMTVDLELYKSWGFRIDATPFFYLQQPDDALASVSIKLFLFLILLTSILYFVLIVLYNRYIYRYSFHVNRSRWYELPVILFLAGFMIVPIRASFGIAPMNIGMVYHSEKQFANHAAINCAWHFGHALSKMKSSSKKYHFMDDEKANQLFEGMMDYDEPVDHYLKSEQPNIVVVILESFTAKVISSLGGEKGITPQFDQLCKEGIYFTNFYSSSDRSDKGLVAIMSGYPTHPVSSIIKFPSKTDKLPYITRKLEKTGYSTSFYYGGDIEFANMQSYLITGGFDKIISMDDFEASLVNSKWGVHDEYVFDRLYKDIVKSDQKFFKVIFTLSSHDPFQVPMKTIIEGGDRDHQFMNSIYYTDRELGRFFRKIKKTDCWNNTLFILLADHGNSRPFNSKVYSQERFHIPMLWTGGVVKTDTLVSRPSGQTDLARTLLEQLKIDASQFKFSNNILSDNQTGFAFYTFNDGFGFIQDTSIVYYDNIGGDYLEIDTSFHEIAEKGKAYLQKLSQDFSSK